MKAAVLHSFGTVPSYEDINDPVPEAGDSVVQVKAVPLENFDKLAAQGMHYASQRMFPQFPAIVGHIGVGVRADGALLALGGTKPPFGTMAETAIIPREYAAYATPVPEGIAPEIAAALPAPALTSLLPLKWGVQLEPGQTVLIQGATGVAGKLAVKIARLLGAGEIVVTGREDSILHWLLHAGASHAIDLKRPDTEIVEMFARHSGAGYNVILDYLWGHPTELLFRAVTPSEAGFQKHRTRYVQIGQAAGASITLHAEALRTSGLELGAGNVSPAVLPEAIKQVWTWILGGNLSIDIEKIPMKDISKAWNQKFPGKRIVIVP